MSKQTDTGTFETLLLRRDGTVVKNLNTRVHRSDPPPECDRGNAHFHPSGKYLVLEVGSPEMGCPNEFSDPGRGGWTNLWAYELATGRWTNLTNYTFQPSGRIYGTLFPNFSRDGTRIVWAKLLAPADLFHVFGQWELHVANFSDVGGPHLKNEGAFRPGNASFYEPHGFTAGDTEIIMSSNIGMPTPLQTLVGNELWLFNPTTGAVRNWTNTPLEYDEHARISPDGKQVVWGSSGEVRIRNLDQSSGRMRLTFFNTWGYPEYSWITWGWAMAWSPDGKEVVVVQQFPGNEKKNKSWVVKLRN